MNAGEAQRTRVRAIGDTMSSRPQTSAAQPAVGRLTQVEIDEKPWYEGIAWIRGPDVHP